jgi:hypothetical protein
MHSHYGKEHYCPVSMFRAYGTSEFEVLEEESHNVRPVDDDDVYDDVSGLFVSNDLKLLFYCAFTNRLYCKVVCLFDCVFLSRKVYQMLTRVLSYVGAIQPEKVQSKNLFGSATEAVISIVKKAAQAANVFAKTGMC